MMGDSRDDYMLTGDPADHTSAAETAAYLRVWEVALAKLKTSDAESADVLISPEEARAVIRSLENASRAAIAGAKVIMRTLDEEALVRVMRTAALADELSGDAGVRAQQQLLGGGDD